MIYRGIMCKSLLQQSKRFQSNKIVCRGCFKVRANERWSLCRNCYYNLELRQRFRPKDENGKCVRSSSEHVKELFTLGRKIPKEPTNYYPGTREKVQVMYDRLQRGEHIHHPLDASLDRLSNLPCEETSEGNIEDELMEA